MNMKQKSTEKKSFNQGLRANLFFNQTAIFTACF